MSHPLSALAIEVPCPGSRPGAARWIPVRTVPNRPARPACRFRPGVSRGQGHDPALRHEGLAASWALQRRLAIASRLTLVLLLGLCASVVLTHPGRVAVKTLLVMPEMVPDAPVRPLLWMTLPPRHEEHTYQSPAGRVDFDLYLPATEGRHGAVILYTGAFGLRREPAFVQFAEALARSGAVVMVPESATLRDGEIRPGEVGGLLQAVAYLRERPEVDPARIGMMGFSVGGSLVLLAAEDEVGREQIAFVNVFGAYYDAQEMLRAVASREIEVAGRRVPWEPDEVTVYTFARQVILSLPDPADRDILSRVYLEGQPDAQAELDRLSPDGRLVWELFEHPSRDRAAEIIGALPRGSREGLTALSPSTRVDRLKADLYVMHGREDRFIPVTHARDLVAAAPAGTVRSFTEYDLFSHVTPDRPVGAATLVRDLFRLSQHAWLVGQEYL